MPFLAAGCFQLGLQSLADSLVAIGFPIIDLTVFAAIVDLPATRALFEFKGWTLHNLAIIAHQIFYLFFFLRYLNPISAYFREIETQILVIFF